MIARKELMRWLETLSGDVAIDDGGTQLIEIGDDGKTTEAWLEVGGVPGHEAKPLKEWLEQLPEPYRTRALSNMLPEHADRPSSDMRDAVCQGFEWDDSPEGFIFWDAVDDHYAFLSLLPPACPRGGPVTDCAEEKRRGQQ